MSLTIDYSLISSDPEGNTNLLYNLKSGMPTYFSFTGPVLSIAPGYSIGSTTFSA